MIFPSHCLFLTALLFGLPLLESALGIHDIFVILLWTPVVGGPTPLLMALLLYIPVTLYVAAPPHLAAQQVARPGQWAPRLAPLAPCRDLK